MRHDGSGAEALRRALAGGPDNLALAVGLPAEGDALALLRGLRTPGRVPVILLGTGHSPAAVARALDQGADDYPTYPVDADELAARAARGGSRSTSPGTSRPAGARASG